MKDKPLPWDSLVDALQDRIHKEKPIKRRKKKPRRVSKEPGPGRDK